MTVFICLKLTDSLSGVGTYETVTTYFVAPWDALTIGAVPMGSVEEVVCGREEECTTEESRWIFEDVGVTQTQPQMVDVSAEVTGVSRNEEPLIEMH